MAKISNISRERAAQQRELLLILGPSALLVAAGLWLASQFVEPAPDRTVVMSTGSAKGTYHLVGQRYAEILARDGIKLELRTSRGSKENATRLMDARSGVKVALVQGGAISASEAPNLVSLGRVYQEPLWIFYRGEQTLTRLSDFAGKRLAIGPEGSGTRNLMLKMLEAAKITDPPATILGPENDVAAESLLRGEIDVVFMATGADSPVVKQLVGSPDVRLANLSQADALVRLNGSLGKVVLPAGAIDLSRNAPEADVTMVASQASLLVRDDLHPAIIGLLVAAAKEVHNPAGLFQKLGEYPIASDPEMPMSDDALRVHQSGQTFLQRRFPFWVATFIERTIVLLIPLATILLPLIKFAPWLYQWRVRRRIWHWYGQLKRLEARLAEPASNPSSSLADEIAQIADAASAIPVPSRYAGELYHLREHIELVRQRIARAA